MAKSEKFNVTAIFGGESSYGNLDGAVAGAKISFMSHSITIGRNDTDVNEFNAKYVTPDTIKGNFTGSGSIVLRMRPKTLGYFLTWFYGAPNTTGQAPGPFTHTFTADSGIVRSFQMEVNRTDVDAGSEYELFKGLIIDSISSPIQVEGQMEITINVQTGIKQTYSGTSVFTSPTDLTTETEVFNSFDATVTNASISNKINNLSYTITRNLELFYGIGDDGEASDFYRDVYSATGDATIRFENADLMTKALADTADNISIGAASGSNSVTFNNPTIKWLPTNQNPDSGTIQQLVTVPFRAYDTLTAVLVNDQSSYAAV